MYFFPKEERLRRGIRRRRRPLVRGQAGSRAAVWSGGMDAHALAEALSNTPARRTYRSFKDFQHDIHRYSQVPMECMYTISMQDNVESFLRPLLLLRGLFYDTENGTVSDYPWLVPDDLAKECSLKTVFGVSFRFPGLGWAIKRKHQNPCHQFLNIHADRSFPVVCF